MFISSADVLSTVSIVFSPGGGAVWSDAMHGFAMNNKAVRIIIMIAEIPFILCSLLARKNVA
jgi:hypothetical protein